MMQFLYQIIISPFENFITLVFNELFRMFEAYEITIIGTSLFMFFISLPCFKQLEPNVFNEKKDGLLKNEKQSTLISVLFLALSIILQFPLIIASYSFFTSNQIPSGTSWLLISDLTEVDRLLSVGGIQINLLPIAILVFYLLCTIFYSSSDIVYKMYPSILGIGLFAFLYDKPSALSLFWVIISLFFLLVVILTKYTKSMYKTTWILLSVTSLLLLVTLFLLGMVESLERRLLFIAFVFLCQMPLLFLYKKSKRAALFSKFVIKNNYATFLNLGISLSLLLGILVPSTVVSSSPTEYLQNGCNPIFILLLNFAQYAGLFVVWASFYYWRADNTGKSIFQLFQWLYFGIYLLNFFFYNKNNIMNTNMTYSWGLESWETGDIAINILLTVIVVLLFFFIIKKYFDYIKGISIVLLAAFVALSAINSVNILNQSMEYREIHKEDGKVKSGILELSKSGKNVVFIMLDRAANEFLPYILCENEKIKEQLSNFVYFPNTLSYGDTTIFAAPAAYGGYEYTPEEMNKRNEELLKDKHNEALLLLPTLFSDAGFSVISCDPPYSNYKIVSDLTIFRNNLNVKSYNLLSSDLYQKINLDVTADMSLRALKYNFGMYSLLKGAPALLQGFIYDEGFYRKVIDRPVSTSFLKSYAELDELDNLTSFSEENETGTFVMLYNGITHEPILLQLPEYRISKNVNNNQLESEYRVDENGNILDLSQETVRKHYYSAMVAFEKLGEWFDYLKMNDVFDNTRIIIVGDHAFSYSQESSKITLEGHHIEALNPILMVKDFNQNAFNVSDKFMTIADVPAICMEGLVENPINPFTNVPINSLVYAKENKQKVLFEEGSNIDNVVEADNIFLSNEWYLVENDALNVAKYHKIDRPCS